MNPKLQRFLWGRSEPTPFVKTMAYFWCGIGVLNTLLGLLQEWFPIAVVSLAALGIIGVEGVVFWHLRKQKSQPN